jgi:hypothetical protein
MYWCSKRDDVALVFQETWCIGVPRDTMLHWCSKRHVVVNTGLRASRQSNHTSCSTGGMSHCEEWGIAVPLHAALFCLQCQDPSYSCAVVYWLRHYATSWKSRVPHPMRWMNFFSIFLILQTIQCHLWTDCLDNVGSLTSHNPIGLQGLLRG